MRRLLTTLAAVAVVLAVSACTSAAADDPAVSSTVVVDAGPDGTASPSAAADPADPAGAGDNAGDPSAELSAEDLAARIVELETALDVPFRDGPQPVTISIPTVGVDAAPIDGVGVEDNGELEVPSARRVGWYRYGPAPGQAGSSVLAAHIASGGVDGAFRYLSEAEVGDRVEVAFDDGSQQTYEIVEMAQYDKDELPFERVFARDGEPLITLITCGGTFQPSVGSYEDNVVAYAVPVTP
ncbi:MAG: class F sortase [Actinomycetota bacterium]